MDAKIEITIDRALQGDKRSIARLISVAENQPGNAVDLMEKLYARGGHSRIIGITGPPGAGKSTLVEKIALTLLNSGKKVGILAVDPSSPFTGGAILGDRIRMNALFCEERVFIRSLATRGSLGGLSLATNYAVTILDSCGFDYILIETVGVGQAEVDIAEVGDFVIVVLVPGLGDEVQNLKAGLLEISDVFVVNKSDLPGAEQLAQQVQVMQHVGEMNLASTAAPVILTQGASGEGVDLLIDGLEALYAESPENVRQRRLRRMKKEFFQLTDYYLDKAMQKESKRLRFFEKNETRLVNRETNPLMMAKSLVGELI